MNTHRTLIHRGLALIPLLATVLLVLVAAPALAHVELISSNPEDGATVAAPPAAISLVFSTDAEPAGDGIVLIDSAGDPLAVEVFQASPDRVVLTPERPLESGTYGVTWTMRAGDAHPKSGSIAFRVDPAAPASSAAGAASAEREQELLEIEPAPAVEEPNRVTGDWVGRIGRWVALLGALVGIGAFAFAATSLVGRKREVEEAGYWVRRGGVLVIIGTVLEVLGASIVLQGSVAGGFAPAALWETIEGAFGIAVLLRLVGGVAMVRGTGLLVAQATAPILDPHGDRSAGSNRFGHTATLVREQPSEITYRLDLRHSVTALVGVVAVALSYLFDGHTVTASPAIVVRIADSAHVLGAGVWVGGVLLMGQTLTARWRAGRALDAAPLAIRFSRVASVALVVVGAAGLALAWSILDSPIELASTSWGRLLLVKLVAVAVAAALGAHNHFVVVPALEADESDETAAMQLRSTVRIEGTILLGVVLVTAVLVGAGS